MAATAGAASAAAGRTTPPRKRPEGVEAPSGPPAFPEWREGMQWTVKSVYRRLPATKARRDARPEEPRSAPQPTEPTFWLFHVKRVKTLGGPDGPDPAGGDRKGPAPTRFLLQVRNQDGSASEKASLYVTRYAPTTERREVLAITQARFYAMVANKPQRSHIDYGRPPDAPHPVLSDSSIIPYDFPVLPFLPRAGARQQPSRLVRPFKFTELMDGLRWAKDTEQIEHQNLPLDQFVDRALVGHMEEHQWPQDRLALVELRRGSPDTLWAKQVWSPHLPWYVYSSTPTSRSWLWDVRWAPPQVAPSGAPARERTERPSGPEGGRRPPAGPSGALPDLRHPGAEGGRRPPAGPSGPLPEAVPTASSPSPGSPGPAPRASASPSGSSSPRRSRP
jgi:hypothetical protein